MGPGISDGLYHPFASPVCERKLDHTIGSDRKSSRPAWKPAPGIKKLAYAARLFFNDLQTHMEKEENILFPAIRSLCQGKSEKSEDINEGDIRSAVLMLEKEHHITMEDLTYFHNLTKGYALPDDACNSWTYLYKKMQEFEEDWKHHVHIENNILFQKALKMDERI